MGTKGYGRDRRRTDVRASAAQLPAGHMNAVGVTPDGVAHESSFDVIGSLREWRMKLVNVLTTATTLAT